MVPKRFLKNNQPFGFKLTLVSRVHVLDDGLRAVTQSLSHSV